MGFCHLKSWHYFSQDQDSLLVKRRNDNHSPGPAENNVATDSIMTLRASNQVLCNLSSYYFYAMTLVTE